jgi:two-component system, NtrC family, response regulator AtoC
LQDGEFARLGGKADVQVDVRLIAATNRDLETAVAAGHFREDLYFRLNVVTINLPPLRERREEIPILTQHFLRKYSVQYNKPVTSITQELAQQFHAYEWPGNVRQLENMIKRLVVLGTEAGITKELMQPIVHAVPRSLPFTASPPAFTTQPPSPVLPPAVTAVAGAPPMSADDDGSCEVEAVAAVAGAAAASGNVSLKDISRSAARDAERELILRMLTRTRWNRKEAAQILGISYKALLYKIKENGLDKAS